MEKDTIYAYKLQHIENPTFDNVQRLARTFINDLPQPMVDEIYDDLNRGVDQLTTEPQMLVYLHAFGSMHEAKLRYAFNQLLDAFRGQPKVNIIDYGCGQAIGTMCYADFLHENGLNQSIGTITLIEPSEICLKRAALHAKAFFPDAEIRTICKGFDDLEPDDIQCDENTPTLHILSNVLDILDFDLERFAKLINGQLCGYNQFVCVGPYFGFSDKDERMERFAELLDADTSFSKKLDKYELNSDKAWTCQINIFCLGELEEELSTTVTEEEIKNGIKDEFGVLYSKDGKKLLKSINKLLNEYRVKSGTKVICNEAFGNNTIQQIIIPNTVISIGNGAFFSCKYLQEIVIPDSVTNIGYYIFEWCESLQRIKLPNAITCIDKYTFRYCESLQQISIPNTVNSIGEQAFYDCKSLQQIDIPNSVTSIGNSAFENCKSLLHITIPNSINDIGLRTFKHCESLQQVTIPNTVKSIGEQAFGDCISLQQIAIPNSVTSIGDGAFKKCKSLQHITIPDSVTCINDVVFNGCSSLEQISIPDTVTRIGDCCFGGCKSLRQITIPQSVTCIENCAFAGCESLRQITIPNTVTKIYDSTFRDCQLLKQVIVPDSLLEIGVAAFLNCNSLRQIILPDTITHIGEDAFVGCKKLVLKSNSKRFIINNSLLIDSENNSAIAYVGNEDSLIIPNTVTTIANCAFRYCDSLRQIIIPDTVTNIGNDAFEGCDSLQQIIIPDTVTSIGNGAFQNCKSLQQANIPDSVTNIGPFAFCNCESLRQIIIPNSVKNINDYAFCNCKSARQIIVPNTVTCIGNNVFKGCYPNIYTANIKSMLPESLSESLWGIRDICYIEKSKDNGITSNKNKDDELPF